MERTYQQFVDFVKSQPEDKPINHSTWKGGEFVGYSQCAVGEFCGGDQEEAYSFAVGELQKENSDLFVGLSRPSYAEQYYPTYGALAKAV